MKSICQELVQSPYRWFGDHWGLAWQNQNNIFSRMRDRDGTCFPSLSSMYALDNYVIYHMIWSRLSFDNDMASKLSNWGLHQ